MGQSPLINKDAASRLQTGPVLETVRFNECNRTEGESIEPSPPGGGWIIAVYVERNGRNKFPWWYDAGNFPDTFRQHRHHQESLPLAGAIAIRYAAGIFDRVPAAACIAAGIPHALINFFANVPSRGRTRVALADRSCYQKSTIDPSTALWIYNGDKSTELLFLTAPLYLIFVMEFINIWRGLFVHK